MKNKSENKHTSGEWTFSEQTHRIHTAGMGHPKTIAVFKNWNDESKANAEHICKCVNAHDDLVAALKMFVDATHNEGENPRKTAIDTQLHANAYDFAIKALQKATGTPEGITSQGFDYVGH